MSFAEAAISYIEAEPRTPATINFVARLSRFFGRTKACQDIGQEEIDKAGRALCRPDAKPATKLRNVTAPARAVLMHAARRGWCSAPLFEKARAGAARTDWMTVAEAEAMIAAAAGRQKHLRPLLVFLFCTGARLGEALELDWREVDLANGRAVLRETKNGSDRIAHLPPRAVAELANLSHREGAVFRGRRRRNGETGPAFRPTSQSATVGYGGQIRSSWATVKKAAGVEKPVTPHHTRHTWASWHYAVHRDLLLLRHEGGWSSVTQVERYAHLTPPGMAPEIGRFWATGLVQFEETGMHNAAKTVA